MGPEASLALREGDRICPRSWLVQSLPYEGIIRIPQLQGGYTTARVPWGDLFKVDGSTNLTYEAIRVALQLHERTKDAMLRAQAEIYELGQHAGQPPIV